MTNSTINQRLKFLVESLSTSVRAFSEAINDSSSNTNNYIGSRQTEPKPEYLAKVINHFSSVNAHWLLTGNGQPFTTDISSTSLQIKAASKKNAVPIAGTTNDITATSTYKSADCEKERDDYRAKFEAAQREIELLIGQVQMQATIIRGKDELLDLLRANSNRPN